MKNVRMGSSVLFGSLVVSGVTALALIVVHAQPNQFQFIVGAVDADGTPVTDLKANEVVMTENGAAANVLKIEPYKVPVKLTVASVLSAESVMVWSMNSTLRPDNRVRTPSARHAAQASAVTSSGLASRNIHGAGVANARCVRHASSTRASSSGGS